MLLVILCSESRSSQITKLRELPWKSGPSGPRS
jgi:hypothetical protein